MKSPLVIKLGTRKSALALAQSSLVISALEKVTPKCNIEVVKITTTGDLKQNEAENINRDKREWIRELEIGLINNQIDLAVHSGKDIPVEIAPETKLVPVLARGTPNDVFILRNGKNVSISELPEGAIIGTSSLRRKAQLVFNYPKLKVREQRGNVNTRIRRLEEDPSLAGLILARAGIERLGVKDLQLEVLGTDIFVPAVNQGILVVQFRRTDLQLEQCLGKISSPELIAVWAAERKVIADLGADCHSAVSAFAEVTSNNMRLTSEVYSVSGRERLRVRHSGNVSEFLKLGEKVAKDLINQGAEKLLRP